MCRARYQYSIRTNDKERKAIMSLFTDGKTCKLSPFYPNASVVIKKIATYLPRKVVADMLRQSRKYGYVITRYVEQPSDLRADFCKTYCQSS